MPDPALAADGALDNAALALSRSKDPALTRAERDGAEDLAAALVTAANQMRSVTR